MWIILAAAIVPGILLLYYVYSKDFNPEPKRMVYKGFLYGCLSVFVSTLISGPLMKLGLFVMQPSDIEEAIKVSFFGAAIPEESAKLLMLWLLLRHSPEFDERYDGLVYAAAVGLGFACVENIFYVVQSGSGWLETSILRAFLSVPGHFAFAVVMGYYYSRNHFDWVKVSAWDQIKVWLYPVLLHGIYDTIAFSVTLGTLGSALMMLGLLVFCFFLFRYTRRLILAEAEKNRLAAIAEKET